MQYKCMVFANPTIARHVIASAFTFRYAHKEALLAPIKKGQTDLEQFCIGLSFKLPLA
jgi:hypothetical protein